jgi:hypothetical protein
MASYPRPYEHAKWIWEVQDAFTGALLPDFAGRLHLIDEVGRVEHLFRPRIGKE